jgi:hypothetical protein
VDEVSESSLVSYIYPFPLSKIRDSSSSFYEAFTVPSICLCIGLEIEDTINTTNNADDEPSIFDKEKGKMDDTNENSDSSTSWEEEKLPYLHPILTFFHVIHCYLAKAPQKFIILILY